MTTIAVFVHFVLTMAAIGEGATFLVTKNTNRAQTSIACSIGANASILIAVAASA